MKLAKPLTARSISIVYYLSLQGSVSFINFDLESVMKVKDLTFHNIHLNDCRTSSRLSMNKLNDLDVSQFYVAICCCVRVRVMDIRKHMTASVFK